MKVKRTTGQRAFLLHMLSGVVFLASISKYCMQRLRTVRTGKFRGELGVLFLYTSRLHQRTFKVLLLQCSYYRTMSHRWSITSLLKSSWRIGDSWNLVKPNGFSRIKILRRGKPPWLAFFLPNAKIWAYLNHFRFVRLTVFRNRKTKNPNEKTVKPSQLIEIELIEMEIELLTVFSQFFRCHLDE